MSASNWVHIDVNEIVAETDKALLCVIDGEKVWIPLSQIADSDDYNKGQRDVSMSVTEWFARQSGLGE